MKSEPKALDARALGLAAGAIAALLTTICALGLAMAPRATTTLASTLIHLDLSEMYRLLSWGTYFVSLTGWTIAVAIVFWAVAALYNRLTSERAGIASPERALAAR